MSDVLKKILEGTDKPRQPEKPKTKPLWSDREDIKKLVDGIIKGKRA